MNGHSARFLPAFASVAALLATAACDNLTPIATGNLRVVVNTIGGDFDRDGYRLVLNGVPVESLAVSASLVKQGLPAGDVTLALDGVASNCSVDGANPRLVTIEAGETAGETFAVACVATGLQITVQTAGIDPDLDGYHLSVDGGPAQQVWVNQVVYVGYLSPGTHTVAITGLAGNCGVAAGLQSIPLATGEQKPVAFSVSCTAASGVLRVESPTTGIDVDPNWYQVVVDNRPPVVLAPNSQYALANLALGDHQVRLADVAPNCSVTGGDSRVVTITGGTMVRDTALVAFVVQCGASSGVIEVSATSAGLDLDDTLELRVNGGTINKFLLGDVLTLPGMAAGDYALQLGAAGNCSVGGANPRTVTVTTGGAVRDTARTSFALSCVAATGVIEVTAATTGSDQDTSYLVQVNLGTSRQLSGNGIVRISGIPAGDHSVALLNIDANCTVPGNPRMLHVSTGGITRDTARTAFSVGCMATTGAVKLVVATSGVDVDPNGYSVRLLGVVLDRTVSLPTGNVTYVVDRMPAGNYLAELSGMAVNCSLAGPNGQAVGVVVGDTTTVQFDVACVAAPELAVVVSRSGWDIFSFKTNGAEVGPLAGTSVDDLEPDWSYDGTKIAFTSHRDGNPEIYRMNADGSGVVRLTVNTGADQEPSWSPDGSKIAYTSFRNGPPDIWVMNADGSNPVQLTTSPADDLQPAWSPDGTRIAFASRRDGNLEIYVMNADGTNQTRLTNTSVDESQPAWSPTSQQLVFTQKVSCYYNECDYDLGVMNADGSVRIALPTSTSDFDPAWSPNGQWIAFTARYCYYDYYYYYYWTCDQLVRAMPLNGTGNLVDIVPGGSQPAWRR